MMRIRMQTRRLPIGSMAAKMGGASSSPRGMPRRQRRVLNDFCLEVRSSNCGCHHGANQRYHMDLPVEGISFLAFPSSHQWNPGPVPGSCVANARRDGSRRISFTSVRVMLLSSTGRRLMIDWTKFQVPGPSNPSCMRSIGECRLVGRSAHHLCASSWCG